MTNFAPKRIAIVQPNRVSVTETFIANHIKHLAEYTEVHTLSGAWMPFYANNKAIMLPIWAKIEQAWAQIVLRREFMQGFTADRVGAYLRKQKIEMVLAEYGPEGVAMLPICRALGVPMVVHFHGLDAHGTDIEARFGEAYKKVFLYATAVVGVSRAMCARLEALGCPPEKIRYIVYGIDTKFVPNLEKKPLDAPKTFLMVGRLVAKKAPLTTIAAFAATVKAFPNAVLRIIGDGPLLEDCKNLAKSLNIAEKVVFAGAQPHEVVADAMRTAFCFVQHSVTAPNGDSEGTPVGILEASFMGLPVVSTLHAGIPDVIVNEKTGLLVEENGLNRMIEAMCRLCASPELAAEMGQKGHEFIAQNFTMQQSIQALWQTLCGK